VIGHVGSPVASGGDGHTEQEHEDRERRRSKSDKPRSTEWTGRQGPTAKVKARELRSLSRQRTSTRLGPALLPDPLVRCGLGRIRAHLSPRGRVGAARESTAAAIRGLLRGNLRGLVRVDLAAADYGESPRGLPVPMDPRKIGGRPAGS
jgi:hypothetical protein